MADLSPGRINIQAEEVAYKAAVSEATFTRLGSAVNFINYYQCNLREFMINGRYGRRPYPHLGAEGLVKYKFNWEIVDLYIYSGEVTAGAGSTILDIKWKPFASGSYTSIFSTLPSFTSAASPFETCGIGHVKTGFTAPILSKSTFNADDQIRFDLLGGVDDGVGAGIGIQFRPR